MWEESFCLSLFEAGGYSLIPVCQSRTYSTFIWFLVPVLEYHHDKLFFLLLFHLWSRVNPTFFPCLNLLVSYIHFWQLMLIASCYYYYCDMLHSAWVWFPQWPSWLSCLLRSYSISDPLLLLRLSFSTCVSDTSLIYMITSFWQG